MNDIPLQGCTPEPLMNYLKALGVFRLVAEQVDPDAQLSWQGGTAQLHTKLEHNELSKFFVELYEPTPIAAPWNGGSGFYGGGSAPLDAIAQSSATRLAPYRRTINRIREFIPKNKPKDAEKVSLLINCRSVLADDVVPWLDVCFALGETGPSYFPLLGSGGNDGRLEFTNNFMQRLSDVISFNDDDPAEVSKSLLAASLYGDTLVVLSKSAIGQFNPGGIGGANGTQGGFEASSQVNSWDFVLMIEGALLFAGSVARRLGTTTSARSVFPFSVESVAVGYGSAVANEETNDGSRAELWLPLWGNRCSLPEIRHLFAEGRAQLGRRQAKNAVEFSLAVNLLGVSRGVKSFIRYGFLKRNGLAFLAAPLGHVDVTPRPQARLLDDPALVRWIDQLRKACRDKERTPVRYQTALRNIDRAMFRFANRSEQGNDAKYLLHVLHALGQAEYTLASGLRFATEKYIRPLGGLSPAWLDHADDGSLEFRLAASLAGIGASKKREVGPLRVFLEQVEITRFATWLPGNTSAVWSRQALATNLAAVFGRRQVEAFRAGIAGVPLTSPFPAALDDVVAFLNQETNDELLSDLLWGLISINWEKVSWRNPPKPTQAIPREFGIPRLLVNQQLYTPKRIEGNRQSGRLQTRYVWTIRKKASEANAKPDPDVFHILASGQREAVKKSVTRAAQRLNSGGLLVNGYRNRRQSGQDVEVSSRFRPDRLLAAMLFPLSDRDLQRIANYILSPPESEE